MANRRGENQSLSVHGRWNRAGTERILQSLLRQNKTKSKLRRNRLSRTYWLWPLAVISAMFSPRAKLTCSAAREEELARPEMPFRVLATLAMGINHPGGYEFVMICSNTLPQVFGAR